MRNLRFAIVAIACAGLASAWAGAAAADLLVERATYDAGARVRSSATVVDLEGDGIQEIVFGTDGGEVVAMTANAAPNGCDHGASGRRGYPP
jgi:hypothetical protein